MVVTLWYRSPELLLGAKVCINSVLSDVLFLVITSNVYFLGILMMHVSVITRNILLL